MHMTCKNTGLKLYTILFLTCFTLFWGMYNRLGLRLFSYIAADFALFLVAAVFCVLIILQNGGRLAIGRGSQLFAGLFLLTCLEVINTQFVAPSQPFYLTLSEAFPYISVCLEAFVLSRLIRNQADLNWFMSAIERAAIVIACCSILQFVLYPHMIIFPTDDLPLRNGLPRIYVGGGSILSIGGLISMGNLLTKRERKAVSWLNIVLVFITLALVRQARSATACLVFVLLAGVLSVSNIPKAVRWIMYMTMAALLIIGFLFADGETLLEALADLDAGLQARMNGIRFFAEKFKDYPLFGMGFITTSGNLDPVSHSLLCSPSGYRFDRSDVGIFGVVNMFGILGVIWYGAFLCRIGANAKKIARTSGLIHGRLILWYLIITSLNLIVMTMQMSMMIALTVVLTDKLRAFSVPDLKGSNDERNHNSVVWSESPIGQ